MSELEHPREVEGLVQVPTVRRGKLPEGKDSFSVQWYGMVDDRDIRSQQFQFPLDITLKQGFMNFHADRTEVMFFGCAKDWPHWPMNVDIEAVQQELLQMVERDATRPLFIAHWPEIGTFATPLTVKVVHDGRIISPKPYNSLAATRLSSVFTRDSGYVWKAIDPDPPLPGSYFGIPTSGLVCTCGRHQLNDMDEYTCC